jgi:hypothetical protein
VSITAIKLLDLDIVVGCQFGSYSACIGGRSRTERGPNAAR